MLWFDRVDFLEDDISLENGFAVFEDVGHGKVAVNAVADLLYGRSIA